MTMYGGEIEKDPGWSFLRQKADLTIKDSLKAYDSKKNCWIPDPEEGFVAVEIKNAKGDLLTVMTPKGVEVKYLHCFIISSCFNFTVNIKTPLLHFQIGSKIKISISFKKLAFGSIRLR